ncbi:hypothetical protein [Mycolicibacterium sp. 120270]|uniref:hypothetical protein n=1 Tax=Mycolicibacterium sp. 120270 TaxID=3090600 RepID=UPI00299DEBF5|nr:hypothetical protein [Mycolicibacterium sp. 120270]MDX1885501.1 hypothetical protein [Mycolicibacterium sp. 120270]
MNRIIVSAGIVGAAVGAVGLAGMGVASADTSAAPDVVGMTYNDAVSKIEDGGGTAKVTVTVGDRENAMGDCLVTSATKAPFMEVSEGAFQHVDSEVLLSLNCDRGVATATTPGASMGSPEGRAFQAKAEEAAKKQQEQEAADAKGGR